MGVIMMSYRMNKTIVFMLMSFLLCSVVADAAATTTYSGVTTTYTAAPTTYGGVVTTTSGVTTTYSGQEIIDENTSKADQTNVAETTQKITEAERIDDGFIVTETTATPKSSGAGFVLSIITICVIGFALKRR